MIGETHTNLLRRVSDYASGKERLALATVLQVIAPTAARPGDKAVVNADSIVDGWLGGGCVQPAVLKTARRVIEDNQPRLIQVGPEGEWSDVDTITDFRSGCLSGGTVLLFVEPLNCAPSLTVMGDSAVARSLCVLAGTIGMDVTRIAPGGNGDDQPPAARVLDDYAQVCDDYVVVATQGKGDLSALAAAVGGSARYVYLVASPTKSGQLKQRLLDRGANAARVAAVEAPAGLDIGAVTPGEIAVSILAAIVQRMRNPGDTAPATVPEQQPTAAREDGGSCCGD